MPRHNDPRNMRCVQVSITIRADDLMQWRAEADRLGVSLSKMIWLRAVAGKPMPSDGHLAMARELAKIGNNLNQAVRLMWREGATSSALAVENTLRACADIQERLSSPIVEAEP